jgi:DNA replication and repair protein RecF
MLRLNNISLYQFKNYRSETFTTNEKVIGITGNNGIGKTNLLDAIYYLCFSRSYFSRSDINAVHHGLQGMRIEGNFLKNDNPEKIVCILRENNKKELSRNSEDYKKLSAHIGQFPTVIIAPDDVEIITGTSEIRRKFLDTLLSQLDATYLLDLITYNKVLQQRNSFLKASADRGYVDEALLSILDQQLAGPGANIYKRRDDFLTSFLPEVVAAYSKIAGATEHLTISYCSQLTELPFDELLNTYRQKDLLLQRTTVGIHRDDLDITLNGEAFKNTASQGQRKSMLFALKLTEFSKLEQEKGFAPLLLLDDVFEKLDSKRMDNLLRTVCVENNGQVFITDTHKDRLQKALEDIRVDFKIIELWNASS